MKVFADYNMQQGNFGVRVKLSDFSMGVVQPYLKTALQFQDLSGKVGVDISATGNVKDVLSASVKGSVSVDDVVLTETSGKTLEVAHLGVGIGDVNLGKNRFVLDSLTLRRASAHFDLYKNSGSPFYVLPVQLPLYFWYGYYAMQQMASELLNMFQAISQ